MSRWPTVALGEICEFKYGKSLPASTRLGGDYQVFGSNGVVGNHSTSHTQGETIVVGRKGSFGKVHFSNEPCWPIDTTYFIDSSSCDHDLKWLHYMLPLLGLTELNRSAAIPGLNREDAYRKRMPLPPIEEQRRIAAILDHAASLRDSRNRTLGILNSLSESVYRDMFSSQQRSALVSQIAASPKDSIRTGPFGSQLLHDEFVDEGVAVLGLDNVVGNKFNLSSKRYITEQKFKDLARYQVYPGDVLISIMGTVGRCVVTPEGIPPTINTKHICAITPDQSQISPGFLRASFLWHPESRRHLMRQTKGSIMNGLNMGIIKSMPIPVPPIDEQLEFDRQTAKIERGIVRQNASKTVLDELFFSLQSRAFRGEL